MAADEATSRYPKALLIGIVGKAFSGKDTFAEMLRAAIVQMESRSPIGETDRSRDKACFDTTQVEGASPYGPIQFRAFATALKDSAETLLSLEKGAAYDRSKRGVIVPTLGITVARFLQLYGEGMRKTFSPTFWVDILFAPFVSSGVDGLIPSRWIVTDTRYKSEAEGIRSRGGILIRIVRPTTESLESKDGRSATHDSETEMDGIDADIVVINDGTLEYLERSAAAVARQIDDILRQRAR